MMIGGLGIIRGQGSGGSQTKVAPFWMDPYPSEIGDEMSTIENEAVIETVALAAINDRRVRHGWPPMNKFPEGFHNANEWRAQARAAIRALAPLIIERCAEVVANSHKALPYDGIDTDYETGIVDAITEAVAAIRALIQKEASDADSE